MLQQTQVARVEPRYREWMARWPTYDALAAAPAADVIVAWSGLGYNRRAVSLHRCAQALVELGGFPREPPSCRSSPGSAPIPPPRSRALPSAPRSPRPTPTPTACSSEPSAPRTCLCPQAGHTPGTRRCSTSAARPASPESHAASAARCKRGARRAAAHSPRCESNRGSRARSGSAAAGSCARSLRPGSCRCTNSTPRRWYRCKATACVQVGPDTARLPTG